MKTIMINWDKGRIWHSDCENKHGGVMVEIKKDVIFDGKSYGLMKCLSCGRQGYYPNGGGGKFEAKEVMQDDRSMQSL